MLKLYVDKRSVCEKYLIGDLRKYFGLTFNIGDGYEFNNSLAFEYHDYKNISKINKEIKYEECKNLFIYRYRAYRVLRCLYDNSKISFDKLEELSKFLFNDKDIVDIYVVYDTNWKESFVIGNIVDGTFMGIILPKQSAIIKQRLEISRREISYWKGIEKVSMTDERRDVLKILMHKIVLKDIPEELFLILERKLRDAQ